MMVNTILVGIGLFALASACATIIAIELVRMNPLDEDDARDLAPPDRKGE